MRGMRKKGKTMRMRRNMTMKRNSTESRSRVQPYDGITALYSCMYSVQCILACRVPLSHVSSGRFIAVFYCTHLNANVQVSAA